METTPLLGSTNNLQVLRSPDPARPYGCQILQPLVAANKRGLRTWDCGLWNGMEVLQQLHPVIQNPQRYLEAINIINGVSRQKVRFRKNCHIFMLLRAAVIIISIVLVSVFIYFFIHYNHVVNRVPFFVRVILCVFGIFVFTVSSVRLALFAWLEEGRIVRELQKAVGQGNLFLFEENVLMGTECNSVLSVVYVSLDGCRRTMSPEQFNEAVLKYSCGYTCCLAKQQYPFTPPPGPGHLMGGVCFCQYVHHEPSSITWI